MTPEPLWRVFGQSIRGASHVRADLPNQDAITWRPESGDGLPLILVVSDGHGSAKSFRSDRGSQLAVAVAAGVLQELVTGLPGSERLSVVKRATEEPLPKELVRRWQVAVDRDLADEPFTEAELDRLRDERGERGCADVARNPRLAYGATVLGVLVTADYLLFLQLGDGDILAVAEDGAVIRPLERDARLIANETTSLCMREAWRELRMRFWANYGSLPALLLAATDGYANSFVNDDAFSKVGSDILAIMRDDGVQSVVEHLPVWLTEASAAGSGDDISLGIVYRADAIAKQRGAGDAESDEETVGELPSEAGAVDREPSPAPVTTDERVPVEADLGPGDRARFVARIKHSGPSEPAKHARLSDAVAAGGSSDRGRGSDSLEDDPAVAAVTDPDGVA